MKKNKEKTDTRSQQRLKLEMQQLKDRLAEAEDTLQAFRDGQVDAVVVSEQNQDRVFTMRSADYMYRSLVEQMHEGAVAITFDGTILYGNRQFAKMMSVRLEKLIGASIFDFVSPLNADYLTSLIKSGKKQGANGEMEVLGEHGASFPVHISVSAFTTDDLPALWMVFADLSQLKLAEIVEFSDDAIFRIKLDGTILTWNKGAENLYGYSGKEIIGHSMEKIFLIDKLEELTHFINRIKKRKQATRFETVGLKKNKEPVDISLNHSPITDPGGKVIGASIIARNISQEKQLERQKDALIGMASHELKTPVTTVKSYAQILGDCLKEQNDQKLLQYVVKLESQVDRITSLINDLLDVSRMEAGKLDLVKEKFNLSELVREVVGDIQELSKHKRIIVEDSLQGKVLADKHRISQVITNLISNAIKYSPGNDRIYVKVFSRAHSVGMTVQDFGIGINKKDLRKIFERFFQVDNGLSKSGTGLGLGLYISHEIIKRHDGEIWVESQKGKGSIFGFSLPIKS